MTDNPFYEDDGPPEVVQRILEALAEGWRQRYPVAVIEIISTSAPAEDGTHEASEDV